MKAAEYVLSRADLREFHYQFRAEMTGPMSERRHGECWSDNPAWTHCACFGAAARAVAPLLEALDAAGAPPMAR